MTDSTRQAETPMTPDASGSVGFAALGLSPAIVKAVTALGYEEATPIQREAIAVLRSGRDLIGQAGTGTGKTAAFALPLIDRLTTQAGATRGHVRGLILVPTRELAMQVAEAVHKYAKHTPLTVVPLYGGAPMDQQIRALHRGVDIVVATPGRALDHLRRQTLTLDRLDVLVLDEADEMLDMGFAEDLETLLSATPSTRQTALFAATMAPRIAAIAERHLRDPVRIVIKAEKRAPGKLPRVRQVAYIATRAQKAQALGRLLEFEDPTSVIVFCRTRLEVDELTDTLKSHGYGAQALHGGMEQKQRDRVMQLFREEKADVLVATDVAARGLDIDHVSHVINYDIPTSPEVYVHRIGRTGRIGREGVAITLVDPREQRALRNIEALTRQKIEIVALPTQAALRARRLEMTRDALKERLVAGGLDETRALVSSLAHDFELLDIAAAAVAMIHAGGEPEPVVQETPAPLPPIDRQRRPENRRSDDRPARQSRDRGDRRERFDRGESSEGGGGTAVLFIAAGKNAGIRPADLVGAIAGEAGLSSRQIGGIQINPKHSLVEVPAALADRVIKALKSTSIRGQKVNVRRSKD
jgi:ATP-dependent RNA helicase DeaD